MSEEKEERKQNIQPRACLVGKKGGLLTLVGSCLALILRALQFLAVSVPQACHIASVSSSHLDRLEIFKHRLWSQFGSTQLSLETARNWQSEITYLCRPLTPQRKMAPSKPALDLNQMINAGKALPKPWIFVRLWSLILSADRARRKHEAVAAEIFGRNRRSSAPGAAVASKTRKTGPAPSLASRIGGGIAKVTRASIYPSELTLISHSALSRTLQGQRERARSQTQAMLTPNGRTIFTP